MQLDDFVYNAVIAVPKYRKRLVIVAIGGLMTVYMANKKMIDDHLSGRAQLERQLKRDSRKSSSKATRRVGVNAVFLSQLKMILPICVPGKL
jgi:UTP-glucose-1-phosphate uridylyltransferase